MVNISKMPKVTKKNKRLLWRRLKIEVSGVKRGNSLFFLQDHDKVWRQIKRQAAYDH